MCYSYWSVLRCVIKPWANWWLDVLPVSDQSFFSLINNFVIGWWFWRILEIHIPRYYFLKYRYFFIFFKFYLEPKLLRRFINPFSSSSSLDDNESNPGSLPVENPLPIGTVLWPPTWSPPGKRATPLGRAARFRPADWGDFWWRKTAFGVVLPKTDDWKNIFLVYFVLFFSQNLFSI